MFIAHRYRISALAALIVAASPAAADPVDVRAYPELATEAVLPPILAELRRTLADPYSIRDFTLCPATRVRVRDGHAVRWTVLFSYNARNSYGGYAGVHMFVALFRDGRISGGISSMEFGSNEGIEGLVNSMNARRMATCPVIPDERIQQLIQGSTYRPGG